MKQFLILFCLLLMLSFMGCTAQPQTTDIAATTLPVYEFTSRLCQGTGLSVTRLITENVSCLHDYTLKVDQMRAMENAKLIIINGAGLEDFMEDALHSKTVVDASHDIFCLEGHDHEGHDHGQDPHIWLSPMHAAQMVNTICAALCAEYPQHQAVFEKNRSELNAELNALQAYGEEKLSDLSCRQLITFHDGFAYLAESFDLEILRAVEEESGSEASAQELIDLIDNVKSFKLPAIFTEVNGSPSAASVVAAEAGVPIYELDMSMAGDSYFESMYQNIDTIQEALQ